MYLFMDESGCLGFDYTKQKTSRYFVIAFLFVSSKRPLEKIVKKTLASIHHYNKKHRGVLHCTKEKPATRQKLLHSLRQQECSIMSIYLNKRKVYTHLQNEKHVLYNYVTNILLDRIFSKKLFPLGSVVTLIASKRETNRFFNDNFASYLNAQVEKVHGIDLRIEIKTPAQERALQVVDFISWAFFRKLEYNDDGYYNLIKEKVVEENPLFP